MLKSTVLANEALFYYCRAMQFLSFKIMQQCMSRLENHAMLRDSATDVFNSQCVLLEKYGLAVIEGVFYRGKLIF